MLNILQELPQSILLGAERHALLSRIKDMGGIWFHGDPDHVLIDETGVTGWRALGDGPEIVAQPTLPNDKNSQFDIAQSAFVFRTALHCGLTLPNAVPSIRKFTAAVIFASPVEPARSLFALNTGASNDMIFLSEAEGEVFAQDRQGAIRVALPAAARSAAKQLVILSYENRKLSLWAGGKLAQHSGRPIGLDAPADLFIGCRSNKSGLSKTLGASCIFDVMFWPDRALLNGSDPTDHATLALLHRYHRWSQ